MKIWQEGLWGGSVVMDQRGERRWSEICTQSPRQDVEGWVGATTEEDVTSFSAPKASAARGGSVCD